MNETQEQQFIFSNLIAYIGNKRRLIPLIRRALNYINEEDSANENKIFIDYFAGSGVVSKMAKSMGFKVISNDIEYYSYIINKTFIEQDNSFLKNFEESGRLDSIIDVLNGLKEYDKKTAYISEYYCPEDDNNPKIDEERMFFTKENGILIDNIRHKIEDFYKTHVINKDEKHYLLSLLTYEASTHSNTSGVFKAFHAGFGGKKKDALNRICKTIELEKVPLSNNSIPGIMKNEDAIKLAKKLNKLDADVVYLDPPYNQHQYGSNYHLLNTIIKNDKPKINKKFIIDGKKIDKSAIRKDWKKTKSDFCYKEKSINSFQKLINLINSKHIFISYSTEGIIPFDTMIHILSKKGKLDIISSPYTRYRGGRQSNSTIDKNIEFILIINTQLKSSKQDIIKIHNTLLKDKFDNIFNEIIPLHQLKENYDFKNKIVNFTINQKTIQFDISPRLSILNPYSTLNKLSFEEKKLLFSTLNHLININNNEKIKSILFIINLNDNFYDMNYLKKKAFILLNKINSKKEERVYNITKNKLFNTINHLNTNTLGIRIKEAM